jgi:hypothetical protein
MILLTEKIRKIQIGAGHMKKSKIGAVGKNNPSQVKANHQMLQKYQLTDFKRA